MPDADSESVALAALRSDEVIRPLVDADDADEDAVITEFVKGALERRNSERLLPQLRSGVQMLSAELGEVVSAHYEPLLANVHATHTLEDKLVRSRKNVEALAQAVHRIRGQCARPYDRLDACVSRLENMQGCAELLRQTQRTLLLCKRLRDSVAAANYTMSEAPVASARASGASAQMGPPPARIDLPKAAAALCEIEGILSSTDLRGVDVVDDELPFVEQAGANVRAQAHAMLRQGISSQSQAQTGAALQVLSNLAELRLTHTSTRSR